MNNDGVEKSQYPTQSVEVITFDFRREVENLLSQDFASQSNNLVLNSNKSDWFKPYELSPGEAIDEIMTGSC